MVYESPKNKCVFVSSTTGSSEILCNQFAAVFFKIECLVNQMVTPFKLKENLR